MCSAERQKVYHQHHGETQFFYDSVTEEFVICHHDMLAYRSRTKMFPFGKNKFVCYNADDSIDVEIHTKITKEATMDFLMMIFHEFDDDGNHVLQKHEFKNLAKTWC